MEAWSPGPERTVRPLAPLTAREPRGAADPAGVVRAVRERLLRIAIETRANVLLTGDTVGGRHYFESRYGEGVLRVKTARRLNAEGPGGIRADRGGEAVFFLDRVELLDPWVQSALVDHLEGLASANGGARPPKVISASRVDLAGRVTDGAFHRPLYLRLATLAIHLPGGWSTETAVPRGRSAAIWIRHGLRP